MCILICFRRLVLIGGWHPGRGMRLSRALPGVQSIATSGAGVFFSETISRGFRLVSRESREISRNPPENGGFCETIEAADSHSPDAENRVTGRSAGNGADFVRIFVLCAPTPGVNLNKPTGGRCLKVASATDCSHRDDAERSCAAGVCPGCDRACAWRDASGTVRRVFRHGAAWSFCLDAESGSDRDAPDVSHPGTPAPRNAAGGRRES